jgi:hypothetical protein
MSSAALPRKILEVCCENTLASRPELAWSWSITVLGNARQHVTTQGDALSFDEVKKLWHSRPASNGPLQRNSADAGSCHGRASRFREPVVDASARAE